jgi:hypothetical protein
MNFFSARAHVHEKKKPLVKNVPTCHRILEHPVSVFCMILFCSKKFLSVSTAATIFLSPRAIQSMASRVVTIDVISDTV